MTTDVRVAVLLVVDRPSALIGLQAVLAANPDIAVVAAVRTMAAAVDEAQRRRPDVLIVDERLGAVSGAEVCEAVREVCPPVRALLLVSRGGNEASRTVALAGAAGYVLRDLKDTAGIQEAVLTIGRSPVPAVLRPGGVSAPACESGPSSAVPASQPPDSAASPRV